tara:strand:- start:2445 stop:3356 length:912 start_codon:yes stop_codon:yes gene_type:complete
MAIVKRLVKGSELTHLELDGNFDDLDNRVNILEMANQSASQVASSSIGNLNDVDLTGVSADSIIKYDAGQNKFIVGSSDLINDTTPQLGGDLDTNGNKITFADSVNAEFGDNGDLKIFHNGGHSIIRETGTGSLYLQSDDNVILSTDSSTKKMIKGVGGGEVVLYHNDVQKLNTSTSGVTVVDELHTEGATPHLTLKRTDNANVPTLRFKGQGGTIGASIDFDGTAGTSNELAFQVYDGVSLAERFRVTYTGAKVNGELVLATPGTAPTASGDPGDQGAIRYDDNFLYIKTASGWKKVALAAV